MENPETSLVKTPQLSEQHIFLDKVLCDGRYLDDFQEKPEEVAYLLNIPITPVIANEVSTTPLNQLLPSLYRAKFAMQVPERRRTTPIVILIIIVIIIGIVIVTVIRRASAGALIKDYSPHKDIKL